MPKPDALSRSLGEAGITVPPLSPLILRDPGPPWAWDRLLFGFEVMSGEAIAAWERLRAVTHRTGLYPVLISDEHGMLSRMSPGPPQEFLEAAATIDAAKWLHRKFKEEAEVLEPGEWPEDATSPDRFATAYTILGGKFRDDLSIVLLPTGTPWEAAAHLGFEARYYDLTADQHVAVHKYWYERHGAELVACSGDTLEFRVTRPPASRADALALAREQCGYCPDIVVQGIQSVQALAAVVLNAPVWYFWWRD